MALVTCKQCGYNISTKAKLCPNCSCSNPFTESKIVFFCNECHSSFSDSNTDTCPKCGNPDLEEMKDKKPSDNLNNKVEIELRESPGSISMQVIVLVASFATAIYLNDNGVDRIIGYLFAAMGLSSFCQLVIKMISYSENDNFIRKSLGEEIKILLVCYFIAITFGIPATYVYEFGYWYRILSIFIGAPGVLLLMIYLVFQYKFDH